MKFRKLIAVLCCIGLCGCADAGYSSYSSWETTPVTEYAEPSYPETSATTAATTKATTAATTEKAFEGYKPIVSPIADFLVTNWIIVAWKVPGVSTDTLLNEGYKVRLYQSDDPESIGELRQSSYVERQLNAMVYESGTYYFRVELYNDKYSQMSDPAAIEVVMPDEPDEPEAEIHQYTHTFSAPEGCTIVADYTSALEQIRNGEQPENFYYTIYFKCPACGHEITISGQQFAYDRDSKNITFNVKCGMSNCPRGKTRITGTIYSYATQIS